LSRENAQAERILDALGNQTRRDILALLKDGPLPVGTIAARFPISRPAVSKHLRILQAAGLVRYHSSGTHNIFYLEPTGFQDARAYLDLFWNEALTNFKRVVEETNQK
jgi:DNA-binding transcriptional ArsR family regulator